MADQDRTQNPGSTVNPLSNSHRTGKDPRSTPRSNPGSNPGASPAGSASSTLVLSVETLTKQFARTRSAAVQGVSFGLRAGEFLSLLGPSGCGKTTLLRLIAGFEQPDQGTIAIRHDPDAPIASQGVNDLPPERRGIGMVFQDYALFPHLTVAQNVAFGLEQRSPGGRQRLGRGAVTTQVETMLNLVGLTDYRHRYPHELSGGQQQRTALARALAVAPALVLLDEPLSNLDVQVRLHLREELRQILRRVGAAAIFVTHDQEEALSISDRVAVMRSGQLEQIGTPEELYQCPRSRFVAEFVTQANFLAARPLGGNRWDTELGAIAVPGAATHLGQGEPAPVLMVRQESLSIAPSPAAMPGSEPGCRGVISDRQFLGREYRYSLTTAQGTNLVTRQPLSVAIAVGAPVQIGIVGTDAQIFG